MFRGLFRFEAGSKYAVFLGFKKIFGVVSYHFFIAKL